MSAQQQLALVGVGEFPGLAVGAVALTWFSIPKAIFARLLLLGRTGASWDCDVFGAVEL